MPAPGIKQADEAVCLGKRSPVNVSIDRQAAAEARAEHVAIVNSSFAAVRAWYVGSESNEATKLKQTCGDFPKFKRDAHDWKHWRTVFKAYNSEHRAVDNSREVSENRGGAAATQPKRRRKSRWGNAPMDTANESGDARKEKRRKRSRWGDASTLTTTLPANMTLTQKKTFLLRVQIEEVNKKLLTVVEDAAALENDPNRPPSPEPIYNDRGVRINTREVRMRKELFQRKRSS